MGVFNNGYAYAYFAFIFANLEIIKKGVISKFATFIILGIKRLILYLFKYIFYNLSIELRTRLT